MLRRKKIQLINSNLLGRLLSEQIATLSSRLITTRNPYVSVIIGTVTETNCFLWNRYPFLSGRELNFRASPPRYLVQVLELASCTAEETLKSSRARVYPSSISNFLPLPPRFSFSRFWTSSCLFLSVLFSQSGKHKEENFPRWLQKGGGGGEEGDNSRAKSSSGGNQRNDARKEREKKDRLIWNRERTGNLISRIAFALSRRVLYFFLSHRGRFSSIPSSSATTSSLLFPPSIGKRRATPRRKQGKKNEKDLFSLQLSACSLIFNELHRPDGFAHRTLSRPLTL